MSKLAQRCKRVATALGFRMPYFMPALARARFVEDQSVGTMGVDQAGTIYCSPAFAAGLGDEELAWCVLHELMHLLVRSHDRRGGRDPGRWNVASDMAINHALRESSSPENPCRLPPWAYYPPGGREGEAAEVLYELLPEGAGGAGGGRPGEGCGVRPAPTAGKQPGQWAEAAAQVKAMAAGTQAGDALAAAIDPPPGAIRWEKLLRATLSQAAAAGRVEQTFSRASRRQLEGIILPGWAGGQARAAVVIDSSRSVEDAWLADAARAAVDVARATGVRVFLAVHDSRLQHAGWASPATPAAVLALARGRGGTDPRPAYEAVAAERCRFSALVHLTDGEFWRWPSRPANCRLLVAGILGRGARKSCEPPGGSREVLVGI